MEKTTIFSSEAELFSVLRERLFTAVIGDILDQLGYDKQFLPPQIQPLRSDMVTAGRALTVLEADMNLVMDPRLIDKPFGLMLEALDDLKENEVYICSGASPTYALWGELMATRAQQLGSVGAVVNGYSRDTKGILDLNFPTFSYGSYAQDQAPRGKVVDFRIPINVNGVVINPGDIVFGDMEGVCVIPREVEEEVISKALKKASEEKLVQRKIREGMSAFDAFSKYGVM